jgi:hypothetical protein
MNESKMYDDIVNFIVDGSPERVLNFKPSDEANQRVEYLISKEKEEALTHEEKKELDRFMVLEHIMRLAKAKARTCPTEQV